MFPFRCQVYKLCLFVILVTVIISIILLWWSFKETVPQKSNVKRLSSHVTALKRLRLTLETLKKSLTCMTSNPNASDINSMVGLSVTAGKLKHILLTLKIPFTQRGNILKTILKESLKEVEMTRKNVYATLADSELSHIRLSDGIFQVDFWNFELPKKRLTLGSECDRFHVDPRYTEFISEVMSNKCLSEVSAPRVGKCRLSEECVDHMIRQPGFKGYSGTHKLFYVIAALRMNCATKAPFLRRMTVAGGEKMIQYACAIANLQFPEDHQDLFLEYVLFGSIAGYDEILQDEWLTKLTEWQAEDGCYYTSALGSLGYLEMVHKTAVAVGVLGSYIALIISQLL
ncbi:UPF0764 protein C16orf89 homolog [Apostichopus japonicus]|uniref:UPF0764 protein C16orf89 homolog n=1 Tax=Stichopus japonicus TaxID=307972 RepID=UPI003AB5D077